ncbi:MAG: RNA-directed polymerase, partial [Haloplasmataceae bacterium]|nr:RNA-directed polymerase [Haloplasmataceae bacterium]
EEGTPQGGPLSPLLANIILNELDKELTKRGLRYVRYADDCMIFFNYELIISYIFANENSCLKLSRL